jgi:hypothetical protein
MCVTRPESVPQTWDDQSDNDFFRIVGSLFGADFLYGAGVLLASNDPADELLVAAGSDVTSLLGVAVAA